MVALELQTSFLKKQCVRSLKRKEGLLCCYTDADRNLQEWRVFVVGNAIEEDDDPYDSRWDEEKCVPAQPQEVQGHLFPKVVPETRECIKHK